MVSEYIEMAYAQFFWMALLASAVGAVLVATMDHGQTAGVRSPALQH